MSPDGSNQTRFASDPNIDTAQAWSPDGSKIAFRSNRDGNSEIYLMNADGAGQINVTNAAAVDFAPHWGP